MNASNRTFRAIGRIGAIAALSLGLLAVRAVPAAAQFSPLRAWGYGLNGEMGNGQEYRNNNEPTTVQIAPTVTQMAVGGGNGMAVKSDGTVWIWGDNSSGQLGDSSLYSSPYPTQIPNFGDVKQVASGSAKLALKNDGYVWAWGSNYSGDLGHGGFDNASHPVPTIVNSLYNIKEISANGHEMALDIYGNVYCWGFNLYGELGTGDTTNYAYPGQVFSISNVRHIAAGEYHSLALKEDGTVWAWGHNEVGELGDGTLTDRYTPVQVVGLTNVVAIAASRDSSMALKSDGSVWYWGFFYGFSSPGVFTRTPVQMTELGYNNIKIAMGYAYILTADQDGNVWGIGSNDYGQIGDPRAGSYAYPAIKLNNLYNVTSLCAAENSSLAQTEAASLAGSVRLEGLSATSTAPYSTTQSVTLVFTAPGVNITRTVTVTTDPYFQVEDLPRGYYSVSIKGYKWLQRVVNVDLYNNPTASIDVTLLAGDANNDNSIDATDFGILVSAYNSDYTIAGSGYDANADFNCDGMIDATDFALFVENYNMVGE